MPHSPVVFLWVKTDISISLLAVVVGFCGLALLVVSLFVFWKLCWPIWRSKTLSAHVEHGLHVGFLEAPPPRAPAVIECKGAEVEKKQPLEVKVNGQSSVKHLEAAMKISQTSPDIPAEVQTALREKVSRQPTKIQRQTTEPTSSSRYRSAVPFPKDINLIKVFMQHQDIPECRESGRSQRGLCPRDTLPHVMQIIPDW